MVNQNPSSRENWLGRFIGVSEASDAQLTQALRAALDSLDVALGAIEHKDGVSAAVRRAQLLGNRGILIRAISVLYHKAEGIIREGQANAAEAATMAEVTASRNIYRTIIPDAEKRAVLERSLEQTSRRNVQTMMTRVLQEDAPLSQRIYRSKVIANGQVSRVVNSHLARGSSAADLAKDLRGFFNPKVPGGVSYAARRLARTEINNAFHAQAMNDMSDRPWITQSRWNLSGSHPKKQPGDECDAYARTGLFPADRIPHKPHPHCLCYITPDLPDVDTLLNDYEAGKYNSWIAEHTEDGLRYSA